MNALKAVMNSGQLILGPMVEELEEKFCQRVGVPTAVGVDNGTNAIFLALLALGVGPGDEVVTVANTAIPTVMAIRMVGATPVFADIDPKTALIDLEGFESRITELTKAVIPVHLYGLPVNMRQLCQIAEKHGVAVIEDCAQAFGASVDGISVGNFGEVGIFSFYPTKPLGAYGDGGMIVSRFEGIKEKLNRLRFYGIEKNYLSVEFGINSRLDEMQAAILLDKLTTFENRNAKLARIFALYRESLLDTDLWFQDVGESVDHAMHLMVVAHSKRDYLVGELLKQGIQTKVHYPHPIHLMPTFNNLGYKPGSLINTEKSCSEVFSLPLYPEISEKDISYVCDVLKGILNEF